jgi:hypothetical protein
MFLKPAKLLILIIICLVIRKILGIIKDLLEGVQADKEV